MDNVSIIKLNLDRKNIASMKGRISNDYYDVECMERLI